jgi:nucleoside-diphosphate-sugar epimerase
MLIHQFPNAVLPVRVVILGAGGFLASSLERVLERAHIAVRPVHPWEIDLTDATAAARVAALLQPEDAVIMPAGLTPEKGRDVATLMKNLRMGESVCAALARSSVAHFVYVSSDGVYDGRFSSLLNEDSSTQPTDLYTLMHTAREMMLRQTCRELQVPFAAVRPVAMYGPGDTHNSYGPNRFVRTACQDGKITLFGGGEEKRHHAFVGDVAEILTGCVLRRSTGVINAATGDAISFRDLAAVVIAAAGREVALECLPRGNPITHRQFDTTSLALAFPQFVATPLATGIAWTVAGAVEPA